MCIRDRSFTAGGSGECNGSTSTTAVGKVCTAMNGLNLDHMSSVSVTYPNGQLACQSVRLRASFDYDYIPPVDVLMNLCTGASVVDHLTLSSTTDMRLEEP